MSKLDSRKLAGAACALFALLAMVSGAQAIPFSVNDRPVTLKPGPEVSLEEIIARAGYTGDYTQSSNALFTAGGGQAEARIVVEFAGYADNNALGVYNLDGDEILLFSGADERNAITTLIFDGSTLVVGGAKYESFGSFGFYLENHTNDGGFKWFSQDILNSDDQFAHFMAFEDERDREGILYFGFEDLARSHTDYDYNDMVVKVTGVRGATPAPEPRAALAFVLGALVIRSAVRRRAARS